MFLSGMGVGGRGGVERVAEWEARRHSHATENMFMVI